jgi:hypothetical protein
MNAKKFTQSEVDRIVALRIKREQERLTKDFEKRLKRCISSVHLTLHQKMGAMKRDIEAEMLEALLPPTGQIARPDCPESSNKTEGGEQQ